MRSMAASQVCRSLVFVCLKLSLFGLERVIWKAAKNCPFFCSELPVSMTTPCVLQMLEGRNRLAGERLMQYERKLLSLESTKRRRQGAAEGRKKSKRKPTPIGNGEDFCFGN